MAHQLSSSPEKPRATVSQPEPVPFVPWDHFIAYEFCWEQGQHVTLVGPTGQGKTTFARTLLPRRRFVVAIGTKPRSESLEALQQEGFLRIDSWPPPTDAEVTKFLLWPDIHSVAAQKTQRNVIRACLESVYEDGGWCVYLDEAYYICDYEFLGLRRLVALLEQQGREIGISMVVSITRPRGVPLDCYEQPSHLFLWRNNDKENQARLGEIQNTDKARVMAEIAQLPEHEVLYIETRTGELLRTRLVL